MGRDEADEADEADERRVTGFADGQFVTQYAIRTPSGGITGLTRGLFGSLGDEVPPTTPPPAVWYSRDEAQRQLDRGTAVKAIPTILVARSIRFQHHPDMTACWVWTGATSNGKPVACFDGLQESARRAVYRSYRGHAPEGNLKPRCGVFLCVNPSHTEKAG